MASNTRKEYKRQWIAHYRSKKRPATRQTSAIFDSSTDEEGFEKVSFCICSICICSFVLHVECLSDHRSLEVLELFMVL